MNDNNKEEIDRFADWVLRIGDGIEHSHNDMLGFSSILNYSSFYTSQSNT